MCPDFSSFFKKKKKPHTSGYVSAHQLSFFESLCSLIDPSLPVNTTNYTVVAPKTFLNFPPVVCQYYVL